MSFHHICLRTRLAPRRKPCAETARLSVPGRRVDRRSRGQRSWLRAAQARQGRTGLVLEAVEVLATFVDCSRVQIGMQEESVVSRMRLDGVVFVVSVERGASPLLMLSRMIEMVLSISEWMRAVLELEKLAPPPEGSELALPEGM